MHGTMRAAAPARRPARRSGDTTRAALLAAAVAEFAHKGLAGARVDAIAARARTNKQLVYHYFGDKDRLYAAALEQVYAAIRLREQQLHLEDQAPEAAMAELVGFSFDYLAEHPEFVALVNDENRHGAGHLRSSQRIREMHLPLVTLVRCTLDRGVAARVFRDDIDAVELYISIAALSYFYFSNNHTLSAIFGARLSSANAAARRRRHVVAFVLSALRPQAQDRRPGRR
jgi:TetR/AcrR family transcriptional regulator